MINIEFPNEIRDRILELETEVRNINTTDEIEINIFSTIKATNKEYVAREFNLNCLVLFIVLGIIIQKILNTRLEK